jgi:hypothetical protein
MHMKITGYALREAIKQHELRRDTAASGFDGSLKAFPGDEKMKPQEIVQVFLTAEEAIAKLQVAQMRYNLAVTVEVAGAGHYVGDKETMTLAEAIKRVGGMGRSEKMWRSAAGPKKDRYGSYASEDEIDPTRVRAKPTMTTSEAVKLATVAGKRAGGFRAAIATANATPVEIEDLSPALFE